MKRYLTPSTLVLATAAFFVSIVLAPPGARADDLGGVNIDVPRDRTARRIGGPILHGKLELSLADAIAMGLENNLAVEIERHAPLIAYEDTRVAWGAYDPDLFAEFGYSSLKTATGNLLLTDPFTVNVNRETDGFGGFRGLLPWLGSQYSIQFDGARQTTNSQVQTFSPELRSSIRAEFRQPLMKDLIWNQPWTEVKQAGLRYDAARDNFREAVMDIVRDTEDAYWLLIATEEQVGVERKSQEASEALLEQTKTQYEVGVVSRVEVVEAEAGVAERDLNVIQARNRYENAQDAFIDLILGPGLRAESTLEIDPTDRPDDYIQYEIDVPEAVKKAFEFRPELAAAQREIDRQEVQVKFAKNQRLPRLDALLRYGSEGIAGAQNPNVDPCRFVEDPVACRADPPEPIPSSNWGDTFDVWDDTPQFTARAIFSIPLGNVQARHTVSRTTLELRRSKTQKRRLEQGIILEVRRAARDLEAAQEGIEAAERRSLAAQEQLRAEAIRLEYGESTPFDVLQRERDLVDAESQKILALQLYRTSATNLDWAQGTILRTRNINIDQVSALR